MADTINDGGPAFPRAAAVWTMPDGRQTGCDALDGMTLRDWFAGQALAGLMSDPGLRPDNVSEFQHMAARLYQVADAMLAERAKGST